VPRRWQLSIFYRLEDYSLVSDQVRIEEIMTHVELISVKDGQDFQKH
jgi:hypothetical protein